MNVSFNSVRCSTFLHFTRLSIVCTCVNGNDCDECVYEQETHKKQRNNERQSMPLRRRYICEKLLAIILLTPFRLLYTSSLWPK